LGSVVYSKPPRFGFDAVNPGRWAFYCHNLYHMQTGMVMEFCYHGINA
jgi:FtsP/CotA-like multicopper oxidase with cupredoxin domain